MLSDVSLQVEAGEALGVVGGSGSGKTTLLRALLALHPPSNGKVISGEITCDGRSVKPGSPSSLRWFRQRVQYIPQDPASSLDPRMTVMQLVREPLRRLGVEGDHEVLVREALRRVGLPLDLLNRRPRELSGGQNQRVAIARALAPSPRFLLADEPVSGLDLPLRDQVLAVLQDLTEKQGLGLVFVSHDLAAVARLCTRTAVLSKGRIVEAGPTSDLVADPAHAATQELLQAVINLPAAAPSEFPSALLAPLP